MQKAEALIAALRLLLLGNPQYIWIYALREFLKQTPFNIYDRTTIEQLVRQHGDIMRKVNELRMMHSSTPSPETGWQYQVPSTTS